MKEIAIKSTLMFFLVAVTVLLVIAAMRVFGNDHFSQSGWYSYDDYKQVYSKTGAADVIVIGNSKALCSLSTKEVTDTTKLICYNLSMAGSNLAHSKLTLNAYLRNATHLPRYCFLEISWFSFNTRRTGFPLTEVSYLLFKDIEPVKYMFRYPELLLYSTKILYGDIKKRFSDKSKPSDRYSSNNSKSDKQDSARGVKFDVKEMNKIFPEFKAGIDSNLLHDFKDIIRICENHNIKLILYDAPELPEYTAKQMDRHLIKQVICNLAAKHNLKYYDFNVDGEFWNKDYISQLGDSHHLKNPDRFTKDFMAVLSQEGMF